MFSSLDLDTLPEAPTVDKEGIMEAKILRSRKEEDLLVIDLGLIDWQDQVTERVCTVYARTRLFDGNGYDVTVNWSAWGEQDGANARAVAQVITWGADIADAIKQHIYQVDTGR